MNWQVVERESRLATGVTKSHHVFLGRISPRGLRAQSCLYFHNSPKNQSVPSRPESQCPDKYNIPAQDGGISHGGMTHLKISSPHTCPRGSRRLLCAMNLEPHNARSWDSYLLLSTPLSLIYADGGGSFVPGTDRMVPVIITLFLVGRSLEGMRWGRSGPCPIPLGRCIICRLSFTQSKKPR